VSAAPQPTSHATEEQAARGEGRARRTRSGAKRPKAGAQLIITKANNETQPEAAQPEAPAVEATAEAVIVPVVTAGTEETPPETPRKTRFGQPRRLRQPAVASTPAAAPVVEQPVVAAEQPTPEAEQPVVEQPAEPARRYRFDRSRSTTIPGAPGARPERLSGPRAGLYTGAPEPAVERAPEPEPEQIFALPPLESLGAGPAELPTLAFEEPETLAGVEPEAPAAEETIEEAAEAAETLEISEMGEGAEGAAGASRRRRRRRRSTAAHNGAHGEMEEAPEEEEQPLPEPETLGAYAEEPPLPELAETPYQEPPRETRGAYTAPPARSRSGRFGYPGRVARRAPAEPTWEAPQQPAAEVSPYSSPEPSFARGFGPTPAGVATPARETYQRPGRVERGVETGGASVAQLGSVIREAINTQTDRLLSELRRQQPPAVTLSIPNTQTAERVGVFVDVANVVYSARNLRTSVDFGHLLDFLRANRRLTRAQAYAPTDPTPGAEQAFLSAVKGLGYRITTKNYKTFANGAKKADLDLDLCMDIVRIVEAKAVDTIVLVSGDSDFLPLLDYCSDHGVRVEVAAFDDAASMILRQSCDLFVNLSLVEGIRG